MVSCLLQLRKVDHILWVRDPRLFKANHDPLSSPTPMSPPSNTDSDSHLHIDYDYVRQPGPRSGKSSYLKVYSLAGFIVFAAWILLRLSRWCGHTLGKNKTDIFVGRGITLPGKAIIYFLLCHTSETEAHRANEIEILGIKFRLYFENHIIPF